MQELPATTSNYQNQLQQHQEQQIGKMSRLDDSLFSPTLCDHYERLAAKLAQSGVVPKNYINKPLDLFVSMAMGYQLGMPVEQAIQDIAVINGRPCLWGDGMLAIVMAHPDFVDIVEEEILQGANVVGYRCTIKRKNKADYTKTFTLDMAKRAGLLHKTGPWSQYPERMLQMRARSFALRDRFPDTLRGIKMAEEVQDYIEGEFSIKSSVPQQSMVVKTPITQTERVKESYLLRQGMTNATNNHDNAENTSNVTRNTLEQTTQQTVTHQESDEMGEHGVEENTPAHENIKSEETTSKVASKKQLDKIGGLIFICDFSADRLSKALKHYGVIGLQELSSENAEDFIGILEKEANK